MSQLGIAYIQIIPSLKGAAEQIRKALGDDAAVFKKTGQEVGGGMMNGLQNAATAVTGALAAGLGTALVKGFSRLNSIDQAKAKLQGLGASAETVDQVMKNALSSVKGTAFGLDSAATAAAGALAAGIKPGKELERNLKLVADAATIAGTDMGSMGAIFNKVAASNKVQMDVINQLHDAGVPILSLLAKQMGVTAEEAAKMASSGAIDFATFQAAMEQGLGGAALSSGNTFAGAMANVAAALGRIGAGLLGGIFPKLAPLFQAAQAALTPLEEKAKQLGDAIGNHINPYIEKLTTFLSAAEIEFGQFTTVIGPLAAAFAALGAGGFAPLISSIPGLSGVAGVLTRISSPIGLVIAGILGLIATSPELQSAFGTALATVLDAVLSLAATFEPFLNALIAALPAAAAAATVVLSGLAAVLVEVGHFIKDNKEVLGVLVAALVAATAAWKTYMFVKKAHMALTKAWTAVQKAAAAAQLALNTAMRANPIGVIITAVTALVGALVYFFTQTELGQEIWQNLMTFLSEAWTNISSFLTDLWNNLSQVFIDAWNAVSQFFTDLWTGIQTFLQGALQFIMDLFLNWTVPGLIISNWETISQFFQDVWNNIVSFFETALQVVLDLFLNWTVPGLIIKHWDDIRNFFQDVWNNIVSFFTTATTNIGTAVLNFLNGVKTVWETVWNAVSSFFKDVWNNIVNSAIGFGNMLRSKFDEVVSFVRSVPEKIIGFFTGLGNRLYESGRALIQGFLNGIKSAFEAAKNFVANGLQSIRNLFPFSPAKEGPFSGRGWVAYSGKSVGETFTQSIADSIKRGRKSISGQLDKVQHDFADFQNQNYSLSSSVTSSAFNPGEFAAPGLFGSTEKSSEIVLAIAGDDSARFRAWVEARGAEVVERFAAPLSSNRLAAHLGV